MNGYATSSMQQRSKQQGRQNSVSGCSAAPGTRQAGHVAVPRGRRRPLQLFPLAVVLLLAFAHASADPAAAGTADSNHGEAAAAQHGKNASSISAPGRLLKQPGADYEVASVPEAHSAVLPPEHPISKVFSCLGKVDGPIIPANHTAYEDKEQVARWG